MIFGHNSYPHSSASVDEEQTCSELRRYEKNPYENINKYNELPKSIADVENVHIYGFSFSPVDEDYMDWIYNHVPVNTKWEVSWYSEIDKQRIDNFILNHWDINKRINLIKLEELTI